MANNFNEKYNYEITEILGVASPQTELDTDWKLAVVKAMLTDKIKDSTENSIDIRNINVENKRPGKGVRLSVSEANNVVDILLQNGYGSMEILEKEYLRRKSLFE